MLQVIGDPVLHSKSPLIHSAMLRHLGLDIPYSPHVVKKGELPQYLAWAAQNGVTGFNATMPHKEDLLPYLTALDTDAGRCGAVNTVVRQGDSWVGHNTDGEGCLQALRTTGLFPARRIVVLGAGGAAKAVALRLARAPGIQSIHVCNRTLARAQALCALDDRLTPASFDQLPALCAQADLLLNCTNLGMAGCPHQFETLSFVAELPQGAGVMDLIYHPDQTLLLQTAKQHGLATCNGLPMLIYQAIFALEYFLGRELPREELAGVVFKALG